MSTNSIAVHKSFGSSPSYLCSRVRCSTGPLLCPRRRSYLLYCFQQNKMSFSSTLSTQANSPSNAQAAALYNSLLHRFPVLTLLSDDLLALFWRTLNLHTESWTSVLNAQTVFTSVHQLGKVAFPNYDPKKKNHPHTVAKDSTKFLFKAMFVLIFIERNLSAFLSAEEFVEKYPQ